MAHVNLRGGKPLHERTPTEIVWLFGVVPILFGGGLLIFVGVQFFDFTGNLAGRDYFGAVWAVVIAAVLMIGLPGTGWRELQRRKALQKPQPAKADPGVADAGL